MVDVTLKHQHNLFMHLLACDSVTTLKVTLMTVNTLHLNGLAIEIVVASCKTELIILGLCIANLNLAETNLGRYCLYYATFLVEQLHEQSIAVGLLGTPLSRILHCYR